MLQENPLIEKDDGEEVDAIIVSSTSQSKNQRDRKRDASPQPRTSSIQGGRLSHDSRSGSVPPLPKGPLRKKRVVKAEQRLSG